MAQQPAAQADKPSAWDVTNTRTGETVRYYSRTRAIKAADRQDQRHGAVICTMRPIWEA